VRALVTGGGGFLGKAIVTRLIERGWSVVTFQRGRYPELERLGAEQHRGDLAQEAAVHDAAAGCDAVFHVAALAVLWGAARDFHRSNVLGTRHVLSACRRHGIRKLVYTSTPAVVHVGDHLEGIDESAPYATRFDSHYPRTKAAAEQEVLAANDAELLTVALRPHLIWGPDDTQLVPRIVERARQGELRLVGDGSKLVDTVYIDNAVHAHLLACDRLSPGASCAGRAYFITNGEPLPLRTIINRILEAAGEPPVERSIPFGVAWAAGAMLETAHRLLPLGGEPRMTRMMARHLATAHWYDISAARRDLGYEPIVSMDEGFERLRAWFGEQHDGGTR
jgi:nucleoside-diphosphate-sugar epimerase